MIISAKHLAPERADLLRNGGTQDKPGIHDGDAKSRLWDVLTIEKGDWFVHS